MPRLFCPDLLPRVKLHRPDAVTREIAFMEVDELGLRHVLEASALLFRNIRCCPSGDMGRRRFPVHPAFHDLADELADSRAVLEAERVGLAERLTHGGEVLCGTSVSPDKDIFQKMNIVELVNAEDRTSVEGPRHIGEGQRGQVMFDEGNVRRQPGDAFIDVGSLLR
jgi:hypothetical protein